MKRIFLFIACMVMLIGANAQSTSVERDYTYGFWSNWSIGASVDYDKYVGNSNFYIGEGANIGVDLRFQKQLSQKWNIRLIGGVPGFFTGDTMQFDRYAMATAGFGFNFTKHFYGFIDGGMAFKGNDFGWVALYADAGLGLNFNVGKHSAIFGELGFDCIADITKDCIYDNAYVKVGYMYNFGLTDLDKKVLEQRKLVLLESETVIFDNDSLQKENKILRENEQYLMDKISHLDNHDSIHHVEIARLNNDKDSLASIIANFKDNQLNYYALPFSVLFDVDSYKINSSEINKVKAIASIMKDDTSVHYTIVGFCDHTGSDAYNQRLSEKRAETVKNMLIKYGVKEEQIKVDAKGKSAPFSDSKLSVNRRVSFYRN